jgi:hypothetical protein
MLILRKAICVSSAAQALVELREKEGKVVEG